MIEIEVKDFGAIKKGGIALKPLTILVGPNNAGKSYVALLVYALLSAGQRTRLGRFVHRLGVPSLEVPLSKEMKKWLSELKRSGQNARLEDAPIDLNDYLGRVTNQMAPQLSESINNEIQRCFGSKIEDLVRNHASKGLRLSVNETESSVHLTFASSKDHLQLVDQEWGDPNSYGQIKIPLDMPVRNLEHLLPNLVARQALSSLFRRTYYLPAARSGILQGHKALASFVLSQLPLFGIQHIEIPTLSGVVVDFISILLRLEGRERSKEIAKVGAFLETEIGKGKIDMTGFGSRSDYPEIFYLSNGERIPLHRASSMISEMAPVILFLKYVVEKGSMLIIEEPEAHLHPDNQRTLARAVVKLIRLGVNVLLTTHSDYFVQQLSNFVLLSKAPVDERTKIGYSEDDYLNATEVGIHLFCLDKSGRASNIRELKVTPRDGIPQSQFVKIAEEIYDETTRLQLQNVNAS